MIALTSAPILGCADLNQPFILEVDASNKGFGDVGFGPAVGQEADREADVGVDPAVL